jgi:hypothetical protein
MEGPNTSIPDCETIELDGEATVHLPPAEWEATLNPLTLHNAVGRFSEPGEGGLLAAPSRNFQVFDPLDLLAACPP